MNSLQLKEPGNVEGAKSFHLSRGISFFEYSEREPKRYDSYVQDGPR